MGNRHCLVLLPGLDGSGKLFTPLLNAFENRFDCIVVDYPDLPGFADYVEHAESFLPRKRAFSLIAESFSGPVAITLMARHGARIESAVLSASFAVSPRPLLTRLAGLRPAAWFTSPTMRRFAIELFGLNGGDYPETRALVLQITACSDPAVLRRRAAILHRVDVSALLPEIDVPVLCLRAGRDRVVPAKNTDILLRGLPRARCVDIDGPHLLLQARPRECAEQIVRQLSA